MAKQKIDTLIFDMDGVLWKENKPLVDLSSLFKLLEERKIKYGFATNNSTKTPHDYQTKLSSFDVQVSPKQIVTSGLNLAKRLKNKYPDGGPLFIVGESGLVEIFEDHGFYHQQNSVLAIVGGMKRSLDFDCLAQATLLLNQGIDFYFTNMDPSFPTPAGNIPGAGALLAFLETASQRKAVVTGKPDPSMIKLAMNNLESNNSTTLVIGDRLETDILGGKNAGCRTALVLTGISILEDIIRMNIVPNMISIDIVDLINNLTSNDWYLNE